MKPMISLQILTATVLLAAPALFAKQAADETSRAERPRIEVCFVLDTTGSMSGLIEGAKQKIWSIANEVIKADPTPVVRFGLIGYRDRGDEYVTRVFDLTDDLDSIYGQLRGFSANGGGDGPESVSQALDEAVKKISWSQDRQVLKIVFLVGDAPPHTDYADGPDYKVVCQDAARKELIINTIQCGNMVETTPIWQEIARLSEGKFASIGQTGNMTVVSTPMDTELAQLNKDLGGTLIGYGSRRMRETVHAKQAAAEAAPVPAAADRLSYNLASGKAVQGEGELIDGLNSGELKLESLKKDDLPEELQKMSKEELKAHIEKQQQKRAELQGRLKTLSEKREAYIRDEMKKLADSGKGDAFDEQVARTIRSQAAKKGISYGPEK